VFLQPSVAVFTTNVNFNTGTGTYKYNNTVTGTVTVTASDPGGKVEDGVIAVIYTSEVPYEVTVSTPSKVVAGEAASVSLSVLDKFGNLAERSVVVDVEIQGTGGATPPFYKEALTVQTTKSVQYTTEVAEDVAVRVSTSDQSISVVPSPTAVVIDPAAASHFLLAITSNTVDAPVTAAVTAQDEFNNTHPLDSNVTVTISNGAAALAGWCFHSLAAPPIAS